MKPRECKPGVAVDCPDMIGSRRMRGGIEKIMGTTSENRLVAVATDEGRLTARPEDLRRVEDEPSWMVSTVELNRGAVVVLFNGKVRKVANVHPVRGVRPPLLAVDYEPVEGDATFTGNTAAPDTLWRLLSTAEENQ